MAESSLILDRRTTKSRSVIFGALRSKGHANVAKSLGISESTFSEWLKNNGDRVALLLTAIGYKPVPVDVECHRASYIADLRRYAAIGISVDPDSLPDTIAPLDFDE